MRFAGAFRPNSPCVTRKKRSQSLPDKPEHSPHRRFVAAFERKKAPPEKASGGVSFSRARGQYSGNPRRKYLRSATAF